MNWALFHYQDIDVWKSQPWYYNSNIVLSIHEAGFAYYYLYKHLTAEYITNLYEYDWIWLMVSDSDFEVVDAQTLAHFLSLWNPGAAQPANTGNTTWSHTLLHNSSNVRVTNFLEVGPLLSIRVKLWELFRGLLNRNFSSGWGVDSILCTCIAKNHGYTLNPNNLTDDSAMASAWVWLWVYESSAKKSDGKRVKHRICPHPMTFNPACLIVDASTLRHQDFHEGKKRGDISLRLFWKRNIGTVTCTGGTGWCLGKRFHIVRQTRDFSFSICISIMTGLPQVQSSEFKFFRTHSWLHIGVVI